MQTDFGNIIFELDLQNAPITTINFLRYVDEQRLKPASFYRVVRMDNQPENDIKIEVIQGGIAFEDSPLMLPPIEHETTKETGILHKDGTISMARNKAGVASSEFFICIGNQPELDFRGKRNSDGLGFAAFGRVIEGLDVVKKIHKQPANGQMIISPVEIIKVKKGSHLIIRHKPK